MKMMIPGVVIVTIMSVSLTATKGNRSDLDVKNIRGDITSNKRMTRSMYRAEKLSDQQPGLVTADQRVVDPLLVDNHTPHTIVNSEALVLNPEQTNMINNLALDQGFMQFFRAQLPKLCALLAVSGGYTALRYYGCVTNDQLCSPTDNWWLAMPDAMVLSVVAALLSPDLVYNLWHTYCVRGTTAR